MLREWLIESGLSESTKPDYRRHAEMWIRHWDVDLKEARPHHVLIWQEAANPTWKQSTRHNSACAIKSLYAHLYGTHPMRNLHVERQDPGPQRTLTKDETAKCLSYLEDQADLQGQSLWKRIRDEAWFKLCLETGLRRAELARLTVRDIDLKSCSLVVQVKGGSNEKAIFSSAISPVLEKWLQVRRRRIKRGERALFIGIKTGRGMKGQAFWTVTRRMAKRLDIPHFGPHAIRRRFAVALFERGANVRQVMILGRWQDPEMPLRYAREYELESARGLLEFGG